MKCLIVSALCVLFIFPVSSVEAQSSKRTLFAPIGEQEYRDLVRENLQTYLSYAYLSKRIRIVTINTSELLGRDDKVLIEPFEGVQIPVRRISLKLTNDNRSFRWTGEYVQAPISRQQFMDQEKARGRDDDPRFVNRIYSQIFELTIAGAQYVYDSATGESRAVLEVRPDPATGRYDVGRAVAEKHKKQGDFYEVAFEVRPPLPEGVTNDYGAPFSATYVVQSLPSDRRYHVVFEIDPNKTVPLGIIDPIKNPDAARRQAEFLDFQQAMESMHGDMSSGENPKEGGSK